MYNLSAQHTTLSCTRLYGTLNGILLNCSGAVINWHGWCGLLTLCCISYLMMIFKYLIFNDVGHILYLSALPFIKNAEENATFAMYFSRQWQDTMFLSLHNVLSVVLSTMRILRSSSLSSTENVMLCVSPLAG